MDLAKVLSALPLILNSISSLSLSAREENQFWLSDFMAGLTWKPESCGEARKYINNKNKQ